MDSKNGFISTVWGPAVWHYLHVMSFAYPNHPTDDERLAYATFIQSLCNVLPCRSCREGLVQNVTRVPLRPIDLRSRPSFAHWMYRLHNEVNRMLRKPMAISFVHVCSRYINARVGRLCISSDNDRRLDVSDVPETCQWTCDAQVVHAVQAHKTHHRTWDDAFWMFVHCVSLNYPPEPTDVHRAQYRQFFVHVVLTTPPASDWSRKLRSIVLDASSEWTIHPQRFDNRRVLAKWVYDVHSEHRRRMHMRALSAPDVFHATYEQYRANCTVDSKMGHGGCSQSAKGAPQKCVVSTM